MTRGMARARRTLYIGGMLPRALALAGLVLLTAPGTALALDEGQWQLGITAELAMGVDHKVYLGGGGRLEGRYGISDALSAWTALGLVQLPMQSYSARVGSVGGGLTLAYDVLRIIPFVSLGLAAVDAHRSRSALLLGGELDAGAEYLLDPRWSVGLLGIVQYCPLEISGERRGLTTASLGLRLAHTF
jgi:hypothetical protein